MKPRLLRSLIRKRSVMTVLQSLLRLAVQKLNFISVARARIDLGSQSTINVTFQPIVWRAYGVFAMKPIERELNWVSNLP